ncbi:MAG: glycosyltransferase involved in cell wall biosynthesis [Bacteroidia bacterium]|jgi:glycosyltransferase involved in cell wall biosynthesis
MGKLVSIIMPVYNAQRFISEAINSVLQQSHSNWELLVINDGSSDGTLEIIKTFDDGRIRLFDQPNQGVSAARNVGLNNMIGDFFCFLDADDRIPSNSLTSRLKVFNLDQVIQFVDGIVGVYNEDFSRKLRVWKPSFQGNPFSDLLNLTGNSFFGPTWMIRRKADVQYAFDEGLTHGEDLLFFMNISRSADALYKCTDEEILYYRIHSNSAMRSGLENIEKGYIYIYRNICNWPEITPKMANGFKKKISSIMFKSYITNGRVLSALRSIL